METKQTARGASTQARASTQNRPPAAYSKKGAKRMEKEKEAEGKPVSIGAILAVLLVLIVVSLLALVYFDLLGFKDMAVRALGLDQPTNREMAALMELEEKNQNILLEIADKESDLNKREKEMARRESAVVVLEEELAQRQEALTQMQILVEGLQTDIGSIALIVADMDPAKAADMMSSLYNTTQIAKVLVSMETEAAAKILNNMQADRAAAVVSEMLRYSS